MKVPHSRYFRLLTCVLFTCLFTASVSMAAGGPITGHSPEGSAVSNPPSTPPPATPTPTPVPVCTQVGQHCILNCPSGTSLDTSAGEPGVCTNECPVWTFAINIYGGNAPGYVDKEYMIQHVTDETGNVVRQGIDDPRLTSDWETWYGTVDGRRNYLAAHSGFAPGAPSWAQSCIMNQFNDLWSRCEAVVRGDRYYSVTQKMDDCVATAFSGLEWDSTYPKSGNAVFNRQRWEGDSYYYAESYFVKGSDGSCVNLRTEPNFGTDLCYLGSLAWMSSPISLIWEAGHDVDSNAAIVRFPLELGSNKAYSVWKASEKAPLLVFDPEHKGNIHSAAQLFGNWTFGGKQFASLDHNSVTGTSRWSNGFEALATLDRNGDNKVSGEELQPLGLWFDANQDGRSEPGEVKALSETDVVALYYSPDYTEPATNNIVARLGYERLVNGHLIRGAAVDWHSDGAGSEEELLQKHLAHDALCRGELDSSQRSSSDSGGSPPQESAAAKASGRDDLSGAWVWKSKDKKFKNAMAKIAPSGLFTFKALPDNKMQGHSYVEVELQPNKAASSMLMHTKFRGTIKTEKDGTRIIHFVSKMPSGSIESIAKILDEGTLLDGKSISTITYLGKPVTIAYTWTATRKKERRESLNR